MRDGFPLLVTFPAVVIGDTAHLEMLLHLLASFVVFPPGIHCRRDHTTRLDNDEIMFHTTLCVRSSRASSQKTPAAHLERISWTTARDLHSRTQLHLDFCFTGPHRNVMG